MAEESGRPEMGLEVAVVGAEEGTEGVAEGVDAPRASDSQDGASTDAEEDGDGPRYEVIDGKRVQVAENGFPARDEEGKVKPNLPAYQICGSKRRRVNAVCTRPAGWGTDHAGSGRCKLHGGASGIVHGRYSGVERERIRDLYEEYREDEDPLNLEEDVAMMRALVRDFIERADENREALFLWYSAVTQRRSNDPKLAAAARLVLEEGAPRNLLDMTDAVKLIAETTKVVKRIEDIRAQNAISRKDLFRVLREMAVVVRHHNDEPSPARRLKLIERDWGRIAVV